MFLSLEGEREEGLESLTSPFLLLCGTGHREWTVFLHFLLNRKLEI